jgi:hypothetical protein
VLSRNATSDCRFASAAPTTDPVDSPELLLKRFGVGRQLVSFGLHPFLLCAINDWVDWRIAPLEGSGRQLLERF